MRFATTLALASLLALGWAGTAFAQEFGTGMSLAIQPGARENGMGAAGVALAEDATGVTWWNPAGLGFVNKSAVDVTYAQLVPTLATDVAYDYACFVKPVQGWGAFAAGLVFLSYGTSEQTDGSGNVIGQFSSYEVSPALSWGTRVLPDFAIGATLKFVRVQLAPTSQAGVGSTFGLDVGGLYRIPSARLNLGVNVQNLGPGFTFLNEGTTSPMPRILRTGFAWDATGQGQVRCLFVGDFLQSLVSSNLRTYHGGAELKYGDQIAGRIGYYSDPLGDIRGLTYGVGLGWKRLTVDFGSIPESANLGNVSKITLGYRF